MTDWLPLAQKELARLPHGDTVRSKKVYTIISIVDATLNPDDSVEAVLTDKTHPRHKKTCHRSTWHDKWKKDPLIWDIFQNVLKIAGNWYDTKELREMKRRQDEWRERAYQKALKIDDKTNSMLDMPLITRVTKDGQTIVMPANWNLGNVAPMMNTADKLARMALDMPTNSIKQEISTPDLIKFVKEEDADLV